MGCVEGQVSSPSALSAYCIHALSAGKKSRIAAGLGAWAHIRRRQQAASTGAASWGFMSCIAPGSVAVVAAAGLHHITADRASAEASVEARAGLYRVLPPPPLLPRAATAAATVAVATHPRPAGAPAPISWTTEASISSSACCSARPLASAHRGESCSGTGSPRLPCDDPTALRSAIKVGSSTSESSGSAFLLDGFGIAQGSACGKRWSSQTTKTPPLDVGRLSAERWALAGAAVAAPPAVRALPPAMHTCRCIAGHIQRSLTTSYADQSNLLPVTVAACSCTAQQAALPSPPPPGNPSALAPAAPPCSAL